MTSAKRTLKGCCCILFPSEADVNINNFTIYTDTFHFYLQTKNWKNPQEMKTTNYSIQSIEPIKIFFIYVKNSFVTQRTITYINSELSQRHMMHKPCLIQDKSKGLSREMMLIEPNSTGAFRVVTAGLLPHRKTWTRAAGTTRKHHREPNTLVILPES